MVPQGTGLTSVRTALRATSSRPGPPGTPAPEVRRPLRGPVRASFVLTTGHRGSSPLTSSGASRFVSISQRGSDFCLPLSGQALRPGSGFGVKCVLILRVLEVSSTVALTWPIQIRKWPVRESRSCVCLVITVGSNMCPAVGRK